jgi:hypothetical protein
MLYAAIRPGRVSEKNVVKYVLSRQQGRGMCNALSSGKRQPMFCLRRVFGNADAIKIRASKIKLSETITGVGGSLVIRGGF